MRHYRDEGIFDGVPNNHDPFPESLGPGGPDIVLHQHLQHHGARHPHGGCSHGRPQNQAGNEEHPEVPQWVFREWNQLQRRRLAPPDGRVDHHHHSQPEVRRCQADDGEGAPHVVGGRILANRRVDADGQGYHQPDYDCQKTKLNGYRQSGEYLLLYCQTATQWFAKAAV